MKCKLADHLDFAIFSSDTGKQKPDAMAKELIFAVLSIVKANNYLPKDNKERLKMIDVFVEVFAPKLKGFEEVIDRKLAYIQSRHNYVSLHQRLAGKDLSTVAYIHVGDSEADLAYARELHINFVGVGTGRLGLADFTRILDQMTKKMGKVLVVDNIGKIGEMGVDGGVFSFDLDFTLIDPSWAKWLACKDGISAFVKEEHQNVVEMAWDRCRSLPVAEYEKAENDYKFYKKHLIVNPLLLTQDEIMDIYRIKGFGSLQRLYIAAFFHALFAWEGKPLVTIKGLKKLSKEADSVEDNTSEKRYALMKNLLDRIDGEVDRRFGGRPFIRELYTIITAKQGQLLERGRKAIDLAKKLREGLDLGVSVCENKIKEAKNYQVFSPVPRLLSELKKDGNVLVLYTNQSNEKGKGLKLLEETMEVREQL